MRLTVGSRCCAASDDPQVVPTREIKTLPDARAVSCDAGCEPANPQPGTQSQRDSIHEPRVARNELPWVTNNQGSSTLNGLNQIPPLRILTPYRNAEIPLGFSRWRLRWAVMSDAHFMRLALRLARRGYGMSIRRRACQ